MQLFCQKYNFFRKESKQEQLKLSQTMTKLVHRRRKSRKRKTTKKTAVTTMMDSRRHQTATNQSQHIQCSYPTHCGRCPSSIPFVLPICLLFNFTPTQVIPSFEMQNLFICVSRPISPLTTPSIYVSNPLQNPSTVHTPFLERLY